MQQIEDAVARGISRAAEGVAFIVEGGGATLVFIQSSNINGRRPVDRALDPIAIRIVDKAGADAATTNRGQVVFVVIGEGVGHATDGARRLIAVGVVTVTVTQCRGHGVFVRGVAIGVDITRVAGDIANAIIGIGVVVRSGAGGAVGGARRIAGERTDQAVKPVVLETIFLTDIEAVHQIVKVCFQSAYSVCLSGNGDSNTAWINSSGGK